MSKKLDPKPDPSTLVIVDNQCHGQRGKFRTELTPDRVADLALRIFEYQDLDDPQPVDERPVAMSIRYSPGSGMVHFLYHAVGDTDQARQWLEINAHIRRDGCMGAHLPDSRQAKDKWGIDQ